MYASLRCAKMFFGFESKSVSHKDWFYADDWCSRTVPLPSFQNAIFQLARANVKLHFTTFSKEVVPLSFASSKQRKKVSMGNVWSLLRFMRMIFSIGISVQWKVDSTTNQMITLIGHWILCHLLGPGARGTSGRCIVVDESKGGLHAWLPQNSSRWYDSTPSNQIESNRIDSTQLQLNRHCIYPPGLIQVPSPSPRRGRHYWHSPAWHGMTWRAVDWSFSLAQPVFLMRYIILSVRPGEIQDENSSIASPRDRPEIPWGGYGQVDGWYIVRDVWCFVCLRQGVLWHGVASDSPSKIRQTNIVRERTNANKQTNNQTVVLSLGRGRLPA